MALTTLEVLLAPAEFEVLVRRDLSQTVCVVFDVLRATSSMITALGNGAESVHPVEEIADALACRQREPGALLAGERDGVRISAEVSGGVGFDLGNSPREFVPEVVRGKTIVMTTTNGTRALRACADARTTLAASFLNLDATARFIARHSPNDLLFICGGTFDQAAYEDVLGAGALCELVWDRYREGVVADSAVLARQLYLAAQSDLLAAMSVSRNARRLLSRPELREDVAFCARRAEFNFVAQAGADGRLRRVEA